MVAAQDRAVWGAHGWDDSDPGAVPDDAILARLLALSLERAGATTATEAAGAPSSRADVF